MLNTRAGLSISELSRIETGQPKPYPRHAIRLAEMLGISQTELIQEIGGGSIGGDTDAAEHSDCSTFQG